MTKRSSVLTAITLAAIVLGLAMRPGQQPVYGQPASPVETAPAGPVGQQGATYPAGWNLVAFPPGTDLSAVSGPLYTFRAGDTSPEEVDPRQGTGLGEGY